MSPIVKRIASGLRKNFAAQMEEHRGEKIAIPLSGGVDSHCALFAALSAGARPAVFSFRLEGRFPRDFRVARETAKTFNLRFTEVVLPSSVKTLQEDVVTLAKFGCRKKSEFECFWPVWYLLPAMKELGVESFFTGHGADTLYCMSRKANQHYAGRADEFRKESFASKTAFQQKLIEKRCEELGLSYTPLFFNNEVLKLFLGSDPRELHTPVQKAPSRGAYPEHFSRCRVYGHQSFQLGDSGIADHFENLLTTPLNHSGSKSVVGIYNRLATLRENSFSVNTPGAGLFPSTTRRKSDDQRRNRESQ